MDKGDTKIILWWVTLVILTICSFESGWISNAAVFSVVLVVTIAMLKVRIVILHFMEVNEAPLALRVPLEIWAIATGSLILALWFGIGV